ncbi:MAG: hypothetical protein U0175_27380 [Caldilineaceae bacterium]
MTNGRAPVARRYIPAHHSPRPTDASRHRRDRDWQAAGVLGQFGERALPEHLVGMAIYMMDVAIGQRRCSRSAGVKST